MINEHGVECIRIKRAELLEKLKENRGAHREIFEKAQVGYRAAVIAELDTMLAEAKSGKRIRRNVALVEPIDQTREYDLAISMLTMSVDETVMLSAHEFAQYVLDDWSWKEQFVTSNASYLR